MEVIENVLLWLDGTKHISSKYEVKYFSQRVNDLNKNVDTSHMFIHMTYQVLQLF